MLSTWSYMAETHVMRYMFEKVVLFHPPTTASALNHMLKIHNQVAFGDEK